MKRCCALWTGRFQPPTVAHMATLHAILQNWGRLVIVVAFDIPAPTHLESEWGLYIAASALSSYGPGKNPFGPDEVQAMWEAGIATACVADRVRVITNGRPEFDPTFVGRFPVDSYDLIQAALCQGDPDIDAAHRDVIPRLHRRPVMQVQTPFKLHNSDIRRRVLVEGGSWEEYLPPGTYEVFLGLDGPERIRKAAGSMNKKS